MDSPFPHGKGLLLCPRLLRQLTAFARQKQKRRITLCIVRSIWAKQLAILKGGAAQCL